MGLFRIKEQGSERSYQCDASQSLLVAMERRGEKLIAVGCRGGGCGACKIHVLEGDYVTKKMSRKHISEEEEGRGVVLSCRTFPKSDMVFTVANECSS